MKVLISDNLHEAGVAVLESQPSIEVVNRPGMKPEELREAIKDADALVIRSATKVTAELIDAAPRLKVVGRAGTGLDNVDIPAASKRGIVVMNTPGGNTITTGEHALSLMMALARNIPQAAQSLREGKWEKKKFQGTELFNKTLGIIGMGRIGTVVAERALGLKMRVLAYDPFITKEVAANLGVELVSLDELMARADFITLGTELFNKTLGIIGMGRIGTVVAERPWASRCGSWPTIPSSPRKWPPISGWSWFPWMNFLPAPTSLPCIPPRPRTPPSS